MDLENEKLRAALSGRRRPEALDDADSNHAPVDDASHSRIEWSIIGIPSQWKRQSMTVETPVLISSEAPDTMVATSIEPKSEHVLPVERAGLVAQIDDALAHLNDCARFASVLDIAAHRLNLTNEALGTIIAADRSTARCWRNGAQVPSATRREASLRRLQEYVASDFAIDMIEEAERRYGIVDLPEVRAQGSRRVVDMTIDLAMAIRLCELWSEFGSNTLRLDHTDTRIFHALNACRAALIK